MVGFDEISRGMGVVDAKGVSLGKVASRGNGRFLARSTGVVQIDFIIDDSFVDHVEDGTVRLSVDQQHLEDLHSPADFKPAERGDPNAQPERFSKDAVERRQSGERIKGVAETGGDSVKALDRDTEADDDEDNLGKS